MKTQKIFFGKFLIALSVIMFSCSDDLLDQPAPDSSVSVNFWKNEADALAALNHTYFKLATSSYIGGRGVIWDFLEVGVTIENFISDMDEPGADAANYNDWTAFSQHQVANNNGQLGIYWNSQYEGIYSANLVIANVSKMTDEQIAADAKRKIIAQAKFLRGFYHLRLINLWDRIIVNMELQSPDDIFHPLGTREEAFAAIERDFTEAAQDLPATWNDLNVGRATKGAALGYLGKVLMYQGKFAQAATTLKQVVDLGVYSLESDYASMFDGSNESSGEIIFKITFSSKLAGGISYWHSSIGAFGPVEFQSNGWESYKPTQKQVDEMLVEGKVAAGGRYDARAYASVFFNDPDVDVYGQTYEDVFGVGATKVAWRKYLYRDGSEPFDFRSDIDWPLLRYADVLLLYAEALNETGSTAQAITIINNVRDIHGQLPAMTGTTKQDVFDQIVHERAVEFAMEGQRFFDLRRWGDVILEAEIRSSNKGNANPSNFSAATDKFMPVPQSEIDNNPKLFSSGN